MLINIIFLNSILAQVQLMEGLWTKFPNNANKFSKTFPLIADINQFVAKRWANTSCVIMYSKYSFLWLVITPNNAQPLWWVGTTWEVT